MFSLVKLDEYDYALEMVRTLGRKMGITSTAAVWTINGFSSSNLASFSQSLPTWVLFIRQVESRHAQGVRSKRAVD